VPVSLARPRAAAVCPHAHARPKLGQLDVGLALLRRAPLNERVQYGCRAKASNAAKRRNDLVQLRVHAGLDVLAELDLIVLPSSDSAGGRRPDGRGELMAITRRRQPGTGTHQVHIGHGADDLIGDLHEPAVRLPHGQLARPVAR